ncbi:Saccharopine dehydrogenase, partial [Coemansia asiatica]
MSLSRKYDIVIWGASSFTGARLVEYLALNAPTDARIAIGGRNKTKLAEVQSRLAAKHVSAADALKAMDILVGDSTDAACMHEIALQTRVVASTVGPYTRFGTELVRA